jgi:sigma-E factor negative regulatory protein RseA
MESGVGTFMNTPTKFSQTGEWLSALADGESAPAEAAAALEACHADPEMLGRWGVYHVIGDVLRAPNVPLSAMSAGFHQRLVAQLSLEPPASGQAGPNRRTPAPLLAEGTPTTVASPAVDAANDHNFRWKLVAGFASLAAVSAIAWTVFGVASPATPQLASAPAAEQVLVDSPRGPVMRDARLEELMAAHKQLGATSAQMPSGFLRNATFETSQTGAGR